MDQLTKPEDAGKPPDGIVSRWLLELALADKKEKDWRKDTQRIIDIFRAESKKTDGKETNTAFNILWSNVETLRPALYNSLPTPDVRRRFRDQDPLGKEVAEILERALSFSVENYDFDCALGGAVLDRLLGGRGVARVRYVPYFRPIEGGEEIVYQEVKVELVDWDDFRVSPVTKWSEATWIAYRHRPTRKECVEQFGEEIGNEIPLSGDIEGVSDKDVDLSVFKRAEVWEILDKQDRQTVWICPQYKRQPLKIEPDKLKLEQFFDCPRPLYAADDTHGLTPVPDFKLYETLANELDRVTERIKRIIKAIKVVGVYAGNVTEISALYEQDDNKLIPASDMAAFLEKGGLGNAIWMAPVETHVKVLIQLYQYRESVKAAIWEITGIADVMRGVSNAQETLGAQQIKANWGTMRIQRSQKEVQRFARDLICLMAEVIANHFNERTLSMMTGLQYPTAMEKQQIAMLQQQAQQMAQTGQQIELPPEFAEMAAKPSWDEIMAVLRDDLLRSYKVDIETDSTISAQLQMEQENITELLAGVVQFAQGIGPLVMQGIMPIEAAKSMLLAAVRRFKLGSEVEDELDKIQMPPPREDPQAQIEKAKLQLKEKETESKLAIEQQKMQHEDARFGAEMQMEGQRMAHEERMQEGELLKQRGAIIAQQQKSRPAEL